MADGLIDFGAMLFGGNKPVADPVVDPVQRPDAIARPGSVGGRQRGRVQQPAPTQNEGSTAPIQQPQAGDPTADWMRLMRKHGVPSERWPELVDKYYGVDRGAASTGLPPALDADIRAYQQRYPGQGTSAPAEPEVAQPSAPPVAVQPQQAPTRQAPAIAQPPPQQAMPAQPRAAPAEPQLRDFGAEIFAAPKIAAPAGLSPTKANQLTYDPERTLGFVDQAKGSFAANDEQWKYLAAKALYPNERPDLAVKRFGVTKDGRYFHRGDDGKFYEVQPPSGLGRLSNIGAGVGAALPAAAAGAAGLVGLPLGGVGSVLAAGAGGYGGEVARQYIGNMLVPEQQQGYSVTSGIKEGVVGGIGQGVGVGLNRFATRFAPPDIGNYNPAQTQHLLGQAERAGVRLTPAEATNMDSLIGEQKRLTSSPRAANQMNTFYGERNQEVAGAWDRFLNTIGPSRDAGELGRQASNIARETLTDAQAARTAAVDPFYQTAERVIGSVNPGNVARFIQQAMPTAKGSDRAALRFVQSQLQRVGPDGAADGTLDMSFRGMNGAKMAIDALLQNEDLAAKNGIDRTAHATLQRARDLIVQAIEAHPAAGGPGGTPGVYQIARNTYEQTTRQVIDPIQEVMAPLLRANPANSSIVRTASAVLDPNTRTPQLVAQARRMIEQRNPQVWGSLVRQFLHDKAHKALQENAKGSVSNVGGNIAKEVGNDKVEDVLRAALRPEQFRAYREIVDVFRATGRALDANSDTAFKAEAIRAAKEKSRGWIGRILNNINPAQALRNASDWYADRNYERQADTIARIFTQGDQQAIQALRQLRQFGPADIRRHLIIGHIVGNSADYGASKALE